ncbi:MAG: Zn-ribbon domain-containing OB-fold protein [Trebonia sp.]
MPRITALGRPVEDDAPAQPAKPSPKPSAESAPFWAAANRGELMIQRCVTTGRYFFYPRTYSPFVTGGAAEWVQVSGRAKLYSYIIDFRPPPAFGPGPNVIAVVELAEGPRMMTNLVGVEPDPEKLPLDMELAVEFDQRGEQAVPVFRPVAQ